MQDKKKDAFKSPDITKLQAVIIDSRTTIYIPLEADAEEAKSRYLSWFDGSKKPDS